MEKKKLDYQKAFTWRSDSGVIALSADDARMMIRLEPSVADHLDGDPFAPEHMHDSEPKTH